MPDVPDQPVARRVEDGMDRNRQLDHAERRSEVTPGHRYGADRLGTQLVGDLPEVGVRQATQCLRRIDVVEKGRGNGHDNLMNG